MKKKILDEITDIDIEVITNDLKDDKLVALVWYGKNNLFGTITEDTLKGLRIRKSGLLIGDRFSANSIFKEDRFNGWVVGEIIILDKDIIPNARRDDFEKNDDYLFLMKKLSRIGEKISDEIRLASKNRNDNQQKAENKSVTTNNINSNNNSTIFKKIDELILEITTNKKLLVKLEKVLNDNEVAADVIEKIIDDIKK